jgi:hypothetical protein
MCLELRQVAFQMKKRLRGEFNATSFETALIFVAENPTTIHAFGYSLSKNCFVGKIFNEDIWGKDKEIFF